MGSFELSKWYMDCVSDAGDVVVAYAARLRWRSVTLHYASLLSRRPGEEARTETSMRATPEPALAGDVLSWAAPALGVEARWSQLTAPAVATIYESSDGNVEWRCLMPRARAEITLGDRVVRGLGYAEHLVLTVEPWRMPIDELRWGRFVGERSALVWIDWQGGHSKQLVLLDGKDVGRTTIDDHGVANERGDVRLAIEDGGSLRRGAIGATALARVPGIDRFPTRILAVDEQKWCARAKLEDERGQDEGWAIHEIVRWPEARRPDSRAPQRGSVAGKLLYGLLFVVVLPALLVAWARATGPVVHAPAWHDHDLGLGLAAAGAGLVLAGWAALHRFGGGLPMNAFPPPRYVTRGVYALVAHPIYVGFAAICFGTSIATGSASGLWLVSPAVVLGMIALVLGYEKPDLDARFGAGRARPWLGVPPPGEAAPTFAQRSAALVLAVAPWLGVHAATTRHGVGSLDGPTAALYVLGLGAPFAVAARADLRALVVRSLLAMPLVFPLHALLPFVTPSLLAVVALLAADAWTARARWTRWIARTLALVLAAGALDPPPGVLVGLAASGAAYAFASNAEALWEGVRAASERVANSWSATRIGPMRVISHGKWAGLAAFGGILVIGSGLGPGPGHFATLVVGAAGGLLGAGLWAQGIEGSAALSRPFGFYGGLLGICVGALAAPLFGTPVWLLLGSVSLAAPFIQGVGRMRCLVQGCCHGAEASETLGIRVTHPVSRVCRLAHLDGVPVHPTPTYSILVNVATFVVIAHLFRVHAPLHVIGGVYFILNGTGRFVEEAYRGEPQTPVYARLRLYQWVALLQVVAGAVITAVASSAAAPTPRLSAAAVAAAALFGPIYWFALGVDFPGSSRRFSRLA